MKSPTPTLHIVYTHIAYKILQILSTPPPPPSPPTLLSPLNSTFIVLPIVMFVWLNGWSHHIGCAILLNDNMDLHMSSFGILVPEGP